MATVRPMAFPRSPEEEGRTGKGWLFLLMFPARWKQRTRFVRFEAEKGDAQDITSAEMIVAGGRGVGSADGFKPLEELATGV
jgi:electron transfer flavoprotein alpha subunit